MADSKPIGTPMVIRCKLYKNNESSVVDVTLYRSMIGKLQYVEHSRPNSAQTVGIVARF